MLRSNQVWTGNFVTLDDTGALSAATVGPVGALYIAGVATAVPVTIAGANPYSFSVTLPVLTASQSCGIYVTATVDGVATAAIVTEDMADNCCSFGSGSVAYAYVVTDGDTGVVLPGVVVTVTTDVAGTNIVAVGTTNAFGSVTFWLDPGVYFFWNQLVGYSFANPDTETVV